MVHQINASNLDGNAYLSEDSEDEENFAKEQLRLQQQKMIRELNEFIVNNKFDNTTGLLVQGDQSFSQVPLVN